MKRLLITMLTLLSTQAFASSTLEACFLIKNDTDRLSCYDKLASTKVKEAKPLLTPPKTLISEKKSVVKESPTQPMVAKTPAPKQISQQDKEKQISDFGKKRKDDQVDKINSKIIGEFREWKKGMIVHLENGQKWKVINASTGYKKMLNPEVEISRGFWGSFNMKVKGLNSIAKVKRIK